MIEASEYRRLAEWLVKVNPERWKFEEDGPGVDEWALLLKGPISVGAGTDFRDRTLLPGFHECWDLDFCYLAEEEIIKQELEEQYGAALVVACGYKYWPDGSDAERDFFRVSHASAEQRAEAMLKVIR